MKKWSLILLLAGLLWLDASVAQPGKTPPKPVAKNIVKDTFAFYLLSTIDKVLQVAEDPLKHPMVLASEHLRTNRTGEGVYQSTIILPRSLTSEFKFFRTDRKAGTSSWSWVATIADTPKGKDPGLQALVQKIDTLLASFDERRKKYGASIYSNAYIGTSCNNRDQVYVTVSFNKKIYNTEQQAIDSLVRLYKPLLSDKRTAKECGEKFAYALTIEGVDNSRAAQLFGDLVKEIANTNIEAAFQVMMGAPFFVDVKVIKSQLSEWQQEQITKMAQKVVDDYNAQYRSTPQKDVVVEKKKEIEKEQPPSDPCAREIWELKIKPGYYISGNGHIAHVKEYSCDNNTYRIAFQDVAMNNKLVFRMINTESMKAYSHTSSAPFSLCNHCQGVGHSNEYTWYQMNSYSGHYARSNKTEKITCGVCRGAGYIKIR